MSAASDLRRSVIMHVAQRAPLAMAAVKIATRAAAPVKTTQLVNSQTVTPSIDALGFSIAVAFAAPQAGWTNDGTRRHTIVPVRKKALFWPGADHPVPRVNHPGNKGTKWFTNATSQQAWSRILAGIFS